MSRIVKIAGRENQPGDDAPLALVVHPDPSFTALARGLNRGGFRTEAASSIEKAKEVLLKLRTQLALLFTYYNASDCRIAGVRNFDSRQLIDLALQKPQIPTVVLSDDGMCHETKRIPSDLKVADLQLIFDDMFFPTDSFDVHKDEAYPRLISAGTALDSLQLALERLGFTFK